MRHLEQRRGAGEQVSCEEVARQAGRAEEHPPAAPHTQRAPHGRWGTSSEGGRAGGVPAEQALSGGRRPPMTHSSRWLGDARGLGKSQRVIFSWCAAEVELLCSLLLGEGDVAGSARPRLCHRPLPCPH